MKNEKIIVGLSGGVDSTVCAYLLKEQGYDVIGVTLDLWQGKSGEQAIRDAAVVANILGIPHEVIYLHDDFKRIVVDNFTAAYQKGLTPNPCVICNRYIKEAALLKKAYEMGAEKIATGHYASVEKHPVTGRYSLKNSVTASKDQTYALYRLTQEQLKAMVLPIGSYNKDEVRRIAEKIDGYIAHKSDSQDICFIPDGKYAEFIKEQGIAIDKPGSFTDTKNNILGEHKGIAYYTIGQRKGLGIAFGKPMYVNSIIADKNEIILSENEELYQTRLYASDITYMAADSFSGGGRFLAKIRYAHKPAWCSVKMVGEDKLECTFDQPQRAITPGQSLVLYDGDYVAGGGIVLP